MRRQHEAFLESAAQEALKSTMQHRLGSVVVHRNAIVSRGYNDYCEPMGRCFSVHAEARALASVRFLPPSIRNQCELYVVRIGTDRMGHPFKLSMPCAHCQQQIEGLGIRRVYYTTNNEYDMQFVAHAKQPNVGTSSVRRRSPTTRAY